MFKFVFTFGWFSSEEVVSPEGIAFKDCVVGLEKAMQVQPEAIDRATRQINRRVTVFSFICFLPSLCN